MKLHELVQSVEFSNVLPVLAVHYKKESKKFCDFYDAYRDAFEEIRGIEPVETTMRVIISWSGPEEDEEKGYYHVSGKDGSLNKDDEDFAQWGEVSEKVANEEVWWAIEGMEWAEWLGCEVELHDGIEWIGPCGIDLESESIHLDRKEVMAHILWEMTFYGYSNTTVQARFNELMEDCQTAIDDIESGKATTVPLGS